MLSGEQQTSSAPGGEEQQEPAAQVTQVTTAPPPSEGLEIPAEEQKVTQPPALSAEQIEELLGRADVKARIYQQAQSMTDKRELQERLAREKAEEERRKSEMDDEEYGSYKRAEEQRTQTRRADVKTALRGLLDQMEVQAASVISNKKTREAMIAKSQSFASFPEYARACTKAEVDYQVAQKMAKRETELTETLTEKIRAEQVEQFYPQLGTGLATAQTPDLHGQDAIAVGLAKEMAKKRKEG